MRLAAALCAALVLCPLQAGAEEQSHDTSVDEAGEGDVLPSTGTHAKLGFGWTTGLGAAYHLIPLDGERSLGLALEWVGSYRTSDLLSLQLRLGLGISHFERSLAAVALGTAVGDWTAGAYVSVTNWLLTGDPAWFLFKLMASIMAYSALLMGFSIAALLYVISPLLATSFAETGVTAAFHLTRVPWLDVFVEGGLGTMMYVNRVRGQISPGWGPLVGVGLRAGSFAAGLHLLWSPPGLNQTRSGHVYAASATMGVAL